jgi:hypothetical protein
MRPERGVRGQLLGIDTRQCADHERHPPQTGGSLCPAANRAVLVGIRNGDVLQPWPG